MIVISILQRYDLSSGEFVWNLSPSLQSRLPYVFLSPSLLDAQHGELLGSCARFPSGGLWIRIRASRLLGL